MGIIWNEENILRFLMLKKNVRIVVLGAELQLSLYNNVSAVKISKMIVVSLKTFVLDRKVTLRTLCTYDH